MSIQIFWSAEIDGTPAVRLAAKAWYELISNDNDHNEVSVFRDDPVFYAKLDNKVVGFLHYYVVGSTCVVLLGYVESEYRNQNIYKSLWNALVERAKKKGWKRIQGGVSLYNTLMQHVCEKLDRKLTAYIVDFDLTNQNSGVTEVCPGWMDNEISEVEEEIKN